METYIAKAKRDLKEMRMSWNRCPCMTELEAGTLARAKPAAGRAGRRAGARLTQPGRPLVSADVLQCWPDQTPTVNAAKTYTVGRYSGHAVQD